jgi:predicted GIY-YIG superfamily endonuclease
MTQYQVYVLRSSAGRFYIGLSENVHLRLEQHNNGLSRWTKNKGPWEIFWQSSFMTLSDARKLENKLKRQKGGGGFTTILKSTS